MATARLVKEYEDVEQAYHAAMRLLRNADVTIGIEPELPRQFERSTSQKRPSETNPSKDTDITNGLPLADWQTPAGTNAPEGADHGRDLRQIPRITKPER
jgi:hypothetical protein